MVQRYLLLTISFFFLFITTNAQAPYWLKNANGPGNDEIYDIVQHQSDYYVTGYFSNNTTFENLTLFAQQGGEGFVAKVNQNGNFVWAKKIGGTYSDKGIAISVMPNGNVVVTGQFVGAIAIDNITLSSSGSSQDIFVACFSPTGTTLWAKKLGGLGIDIVSDVKCDNQNNIIVTGQFIGKIVLGLDSLESGLNPLNSTYSYDIFITKLNSEGDFIWTKHALTKKHDRSGKIAIGSDNSIFVSGNFTDTLTLGNVYQNNSLNMGFIVHYDENGEHLWFRRVQSSITEIMDIACTDSLLYMTGSYSGIQRFANDETTSNWQNIAPNSYPNKFYVAAYNYQGILQQTMVEGSNSLIKPKAICPIPTGGFFISGEFECQHTQYQSAYGNGLFISRGYKDIFVAEFSESNTRLWAKQIGSIGVDEVNSMVINSFGRPVFAGSFSNSLASPAKNSWGNKPWYQYFTTNYGPSPTFQGDPLVNYCNDTEYNFYAVINSQGSKDMLIANIADTTRSTMDIFRRSEGTCNLSPTYGSVESYSEGECINLKARAIVSTASTHINGIAYSYNWNGNSSSSSTYAPSSSGNVNLTASGANTCYSFSDTVSIDLYPTIPTPVVAITGGNFVNLSTSQNFCSISLTANQDSIIILTGNVPSSAFTYSWHLPGNIVQPSNVLAVDNNLLGLYTYVITDPLSGCSKSFCFNLRYPDTLTTPGGGSGPGSLVDLRFKLGDQILQEGDTLFGCLYDELELTMVNVADPNNIVEAVVPYYGTWTQSSNNVGISNPNIVTINTHTKSIFLRSDTLNNGVAHVGIIFHTGNVQYPAYVYSQAYHIVIYPQPTFPYSISGDLQSICPGDTARFTLDTELNYDFQLDTWQNTITSQDPFSFYTVIPQTYSITFYDTTNLGCTGTWNDQFSMTYFQAPPILVNPANGVVCNDEMVTLSIPGATEILWVGPSGDTLSTDLVYSTNIAGLYYAVIVDEYACNQITSVVNIRDRSSFGYELSPLSICPGETAEISLFALQGDNIQWLPPFSGNSLVQTTTSPGLYRFTAPLCGIIDTFDVNVPGPIYTAQIISNGDSLICPHDTIVLSSLYSNSVNLTWFNNFSNDAEINVTEGGTYILQLVDENACGTYDTLTIADLPGSEAPAMPANSYYCGLDSILLSIDSGDSLVWFLGDEQVAFGPDYIYYPEYFSTTLFIASLNSESGCNSELIEYPIVAKKTLEIPLENASFTLCEGDSFQISVTPLLFEASSYQLYVPFQNNYTIVSDSLFSISHVVPGNAGVYALIFQGDTAKYCAGDTLLFTLIVLPVPQVSVSASNVYLCSDEVVSFWVDENPEIVDRYWSYYNQQYFVDTLSIPNNSLSDSEIILQFHATLQNGCPIDLIDTIQRGIRPPDPYFLDSLVACSGDQVALVLPDNQTAIWFIGNVPVTPNPVNTYLFNSYANHSPITVMNSDANGVCPSRYDTIPILVKPRINIPDINNAALCPGVSRIFSFNPDLHGAESFYWKDMVSDTIIAFNQNQITVPAIAATIGLFAFPIESKCGSDSTIFYITVQTLPTLTVTSLQNDTICLNDGIAYSASTSSQVGSIGAYLNGSTSVASVCYNCSNHDFLLANSVVNGLQLGQNTIRTRVNTTGACVIERTDTFEVITQPIPSFTMDNIMVCVGDTIQIQPPGTGIYDWMETNSFNYLTYPYYGISIPFDIYGEATASIDYVVDSDNPSVYLTSVNPVTLCRSDFYQVPIYIKPSIDLPQFNDLGICANDSVFLGFSPNVELIGNYQWTLPNGSASHDSLLLVYGADLEGMGQYELIAYASELSCGIDSAHFTLESYEIPILSLQPDSFHVCTGRPWIIHATITGDAQFEWNYDGISSQSNPLIINYQDYSEDSLLVTGIATTSQGCVVTQYVEIAVYQTPEVPDLTVPTTVCAQDTIVLILNNTLLPDQEFLFQSNVYFGENGNQLLYIPGEQDTTVNVLSYIATEHCSSDTLVTILKVHQLPIFNLGNDSLLFCFGVGLMLDGPAGYTSYVWDNGATEESIEVNETGTYSLLVTDQNGCVFTDTIFVVGDWPIFDIINDTINFCFGDPAQLTGPEGFDNYAWSNGSTSKSIQVNETGLYLLTITDINGCTFSDSIFVQGGDCEVQNQPNVFTPNDDAFNDKFKLKPYGYTSYSMIIHDRWGKHIKDVTYADDGWDGRDAFGEAMPEGVYYFVARVNYLNQTSEEIRGMIQLLR
jgi:gliding motility-associated-like protein